MARYVVAGSRPWNRALFDTRLDVLPGTWDFVTRPEELDRALEEGDPRYVFFLHWSHRVPATITSRHECVNFHMSDLPFGRGGSPLQHLILAGHEQTVLTALRMTEVMDAGPVYAKVPLSLHGTAEEIYRRAGELSADLIQRIITETPAPTPQEGPVVQFRRRSPDESELGALSSLDGLHDFIRMLDAEGYPHAFLVHDGLRFEFRRSARYADRVVADVTITEEHR